MLGRILISGVLKPDSAARWLTWFAFAAVKDVLPGRDADHTGTCETQLPVLWQVAYVDRRIDWAQ